ncbi:MAG: hypothetical protein V1494_05390 [Candidatus Diapherotrites archaeon]
MGELKPNISIMSILFALKSRQPLLKENTLCVYQISENIEEEYFGLLEGKISENATMLLAIPTNIDHSLSPKGIQCGTIMTIVKKNESSQNINKKFEKILKQANDIIPDFENKIIWIEKMTPTTYLKELGSDSIFGLIETKKMQKPQNKLSIEGLFCVGDSTQPNVSCCTQAVKSGINVATEINRHSSF